MKKGISFLLVFILMGCFFLPASAQVLVLTQPLLGEELYPQGSTLDEARFLMAYAYPQVIAETEADQNINAYYREVEEDLLQMVGPMMYDQAAGTLDAEIAAYLHINYQITANTDDFFSVLLTREQFMGAAESQMAEANVFARKGDSAGGIVALPAVLGLNEGDETAATRLVDTVYDLVWDIILEQIQADSVEYFEELTEEGLFAEFYPESDFYLDDQGNVVFFVQPSTIATGAAGLLTFPFSMAELLAEMEKR